MRAFLGAWWQDLRYAVRMLAKNPGFTAVAVVTLALGIGANTTIFSLANAILLRPMAGKNPGELVSVYTSDFSGPPYGSSSYPDYRDFRAQSQEVLTGLAACTPFPISWRSGERTEVVFAELVSANYFGVLGVEPLRGRMFLPEEDAATPSGPVVVASHGFWQKRFGGDPNLVGQSVILNGLAYTVVGVAPPAFTGGLRVLQVDLWVPSVMQPQAMPGNDRLDNRGARSYMLFGRLRPGVTQQQAQTRFTVLAGQLQSAYPDEWTDLRKQGRRITLVEESRSRVPPQVFLPVTGFLGLLLAVVGAVLLIACANLASLLLARATARRKEVAIRLAMGAGRWRLVRQLLTESWVLSMLGGAAGLLVAAWVTGLVALFRPPVPVPIALDLRPDFRVLLFTFAAATLTTLAMGIAPALQATRGEITAALKETRIVGGGRRRWSLRNLLVAGQTAACLVLLIGAGLLLRSLQKAYSLDLGFDPDRMALLQFELKLLGVDEPRGRLLQEQIVERAGAIPGVRSAVLAEVPLLGLEAQQRRGFEVEGYAPRTNEDLELHNNTVGPGYFAALGIRLLRGREFTPQDRTGAAPVVIVNEAFARRYWPGQNPLGKRLRSGRDRMEVISVAANARYVSFSDDSLPVVFQPLLQYYSSSATLHVRTAGDPAAFLPALRRELLQVEKNLPVMASLTMWDNVGTSLLPARAAGVVFGVFGLLALVLAAVGIYGVTAYAVSQRTAEIGIRMAMGAGPREAVKLILRQGLRLWLWGAAVGLALAIGVTRFLSSLLYGVSALDPVAFAAVLVMLLAVAALACYVPARRAARVDPMTALRYE